MRCVSRLAAVFVISCAVSSPAQSQSLWESLFGPSSGASSQPAPQQSSVLTPGGRAYGFPGSAASVRRLDTDDGMRESGARYRTVCVRMCDGFHFPVSTSTTRRGFLRDQMRCQASCGTEARLFFLPANSLDMDDAVDLSGRPYTSMRTANLFKKTMVSGCQCRPDPWSAAELGRHRQYADSEEPERAKAHAVAIAQVVVDSGGVPAPVAEPSPSAPTEAATAADPPPTPPSPVPARRPPLLTAKPVQVVRAAPRGPVPVRLTATPAQVALLRQQQQQQSQAAGLFGGMLGSTSNLTWPGDAPKAR